MEKDRDRENGEGQIQRGQRQIETQNVYKDRDRDNGEKQRQREWRRIDSGRVEMDRDTDYVHV